MRTPQEIATAFHRTSDLVDSKPFFLVGIGGAGMSSLAFMLKRRGIKVRGSDSTASPVTDALERAGISVAIGHHSAEISSSDQVVLSDAIVLEDSPEVAQARHHGCPLFRRSQLLGWILKGQKIIAVTGTHGKTTTTAMIGAGMRAAGEDPTIVVGAVVPEFKGSVIEGNGAWAVVEACEAYDSFHDLQPDVIVLTNLELDHVDFHQSWERLKESVLRFVNSLPADGLLVYAEEDAGAREIADAFGGHKFGYRSSQSSDLELQVSGEHNRTNAAGAIAALAHAGVAKEKAKPGIESFRGAERRLQLLAENEKGITVIDDYAHHPTEIRASISALKERYPDRRIVVVYQPHLYSRTADLIDDFAQALSLADQVVITDIYPAREDPMPGVSSARIAEGVTVPCLYVPSRHLLPREVRRISKEGDVVVGMGAGNIADFAPAFIQEISRTTYAEALDGKKLKVAVAYAGDSAEREVSLHSGRAVAAALQRSGHDAYLVDFSELLLQGKALSKFVGPDRPDCVVLAVHGTNAEDGAIQGLLELLHLPYSGSNIQSSAIAMDKNLSKQILERQGIRVPKGELVLDWKSLRGVSAPCVVKPNAQGSTVGLTFVESDSELQAAVEKALVFGSGALVEEWLHGMEISVPVLGDRPLNPVEIAPASGRYDFASKYLPGATEEIVPARLPDHLLEAAKLIALRSHMALKCAGATRTDMIVDVEQETITVLEVNTLPGMTATSLLPNSAQSLGISMEELCEWIALDALKWYAEKA